MRVADNRDIWREFGKAYVQQWSVELKLIEVRVSFRESLLRKKKIS